MVDLLKKINKIFRYIIIGLLIILAILSNHYKYGDCNVCKLELNGTILDGSQFLDIYSKICLNPPELPRSFNLQNLSRFFNKS